MIVQITTHPFGEASRLLVDEGWEVRFNTFGRRLLSEEVSMVVDDADAVIAGTEPYTQEVIEKASYLKTIARVGVGYDNIDLRACKEKGIVVTYTPEAPADSVADLTVANIINLLRGVCICNQGIRQGKWNRFMGKMLYEIVVGVLGVGRIGKRVIKRLKAFDAGILACDLEPDYEFGEVNDVEFVSKEDLFAECDLVTIHIPMNERNHYCVGKQELREVKYVVNTSRGGVLDEKALLHLLEIGSLQGAALDVFENEPYRGKLIEMNNVILTPHIGSSTFGCRRVMEMGAVLNCIAVLKGEAPKDIIKEE